jgi:outer membrane receptor protein involved in Fe transport
MKNNILRKLKMATFYSFSGLLLQAIVVNLLFASIPMEGQNLKNIKINMNVENVPIESALKIISDKTGFTFTYRADEIAKDKKVTIILNDESLYDALEKIAKECGLSFSRVNDQIVVRKTDSEGDINVTSVESATIRGKVTDEKTGEILIGASVALRGTTLGAYTNAKGLYDIANVKPGKYTVAASYVGYSVSVKEVTVTSGKTIDVDFQLGQSALNLDEVVVTGSLSERSIRESANPITVISPKELENRDLSSLGAVLQSVPGIVIGSTNDNISQSGRMFDETIANMNIRGAGASVGNKIKIIVDGNELADQSMLTFLDPEQIEKIEVIRGPMGSTLYGSGSSEGIIQVFTKRGAGRLSVNFKSTITSQESKYQDKDPFNSQYSLMVNGSKGELTYNIGANYAVFPISRWARNNGIDEHDWSFNANMAGKISDISIDINVMKGMSTAGYSVIDQWYKIALEQGWSNPTSSYIYPVYYDYRYKTRQVMTMLNLKQPISDNFYHSLNVSYSEMNNNQNDFSGTKAYNSSGNLFYYYKSTLSQLIMTNAKYFMNWKQPVTDFFKVEITGGLDYSERLVYSATDYYSTPYRDDLILTGLQSPVSSGGSMTSTTKAVFFESVWGFWNNLFLTTGYRAEKNNGNGENTGWSSIPKVGLTYVFEIDKFTLKPRISWGKSTQPVPPMYKADKITTSGSYTIWQVGNPDLKPQTQQGWEFGGDIYYGTNYSLNITYYHQKFDNMVGQVTLVDPTVYMKYTFENIWQVLNNGWEISARAIVNPFTFDVAYTHITSKYGEGFPTASSNNSGNPEYHEGGRVKGIPSGSLFIRATTTLPAVLPWSPKGGSFTLEFVQQGEEYNQDYVYYYKVISETTKGGYLYKVFPSYYRINTRLDYMVLKNVVLFADVQNLLNNQDMLYTGPLKGRTISFGFNVKY